MQSPCSNSVQLAERRVRFRSARSGPPSARAPTLFAAWRRWAPLCRRPPVRKGPLRPNRQQSRPLKARKRAQQAHTLQMTRPSAQSLVHSILLDQQPTPCLLRLHLHPQAQSPASQAAPSLASARQCEQAANVIPGRLEVRMQKLVSSETPSAWWRALQKTLAAWKSGACRCKQTLILSALWLMIPLFLY